MKNQLSRHAIHQIKHLQTIIRCPLETKYELHPWECRCVVYSWDSNRNKLFAIQKTGNVKTENKRVLSNTHEGYVTQSSLCAF